MQKTVICHGKAGQVNVAQQQVNVSDKDGS